MKIKNRRQPLDFQSLTDEPNGSRTESDSAAGPSEAETAPDAGPEDHDLELTDAPAEAAETAQADVRAPAFDPPLNLRDPTSQGEV
ncbi:MAG: hypothetical protein ACOY4G_11255, partial [Pseudomonadota bacterium]